MKDLQKAKYNETERNEASYIGSNGCGTLKIPGYSPNDGSEDPAAVKWESGYQIKQDQDGIDEGEIPDQCQER